MYKVYKNKEAALRVIERTGRINIDGNWALNHLTEELRDDEEVMMKLIESEYRNCRHLSNRLKHDKDFIKEVIKAVCYGYYSYYEDLLAEEFKQDREFNLELAVMTNGEIVERTQFSDDKEFIIEVLIATLGRAADSLNIGWKKKEFIIEIINRMGEDCLAVYAKVADKFYYEERKEVALAAIQNNKYAYLLIPSLELQQDEDIKKAAGRN